ncbi:fumarylacetoacetase-like protein [Acinetobacter calcoaceticus]|uniref:Fumarylacetoacetase-like protein n=1 Tax=Acinetobacter calcoaceticus TaxID=471 RepID=A0A4R1Y5V7_ACICA|nr:fumarylacetoacetase-like protein [Acinetobacter calcoaceticus]
MKLLSFEINGQPSFGLLQQQSVLDLKLKLNGKYADLKSLLNEADYLDIVAGVATAAADYSLHEIQFAPVIPNPRQIFCIGLNYADHVKETQREVTEKPMIFMRVAPSQVGHAQPLLKPIETEFVDYEGEIAIIIGTGSRRISKAVEIEIDKIGILSNTVRTELKSYSINNSAPSTLNRNESHE